MTEQKVILCRGLQACGKSTWAKQYVREHTDWKRVNRDSLRAMIDDGVWSGKHEKFIVAMRNTFIREALERGYNVIVDDTNLDESNLQSVTAIVETINLKRQFGNEPILRPGEKPSGVVKPAITVEIKDFPTDPKECMIRDENRTEGQVGNKVILKAYAKYMAKDFVPLPWDAKLPDCIICDVDNTLSLKGSRYAFDFERAYEDEVNQTVLFALEAMLIHAGLCNLVILSGREEKYREITTRFLEEKCLFLSNEYQLIMRATGDSRPDTEVKRELYEQHIKGKYNVKLCLDDRVGVVRMWRELGINCFEVREGLF